MLVKRAELVINKNGAMNIENIVSVWLLGVGASSVWFFLSRSRVRQGRIILLSIPTVVLPILFIYYSYNYLTYQSVYIPFLVIMMEELIKFISARMYFPNQMEAFFSASLFGIWEIIVIKPMVVSGDPVMPIVLLIAPVVAVIMHAVTSGIYAFRLKRWPVLQILLCSIIHIVFNESRDLYVFSDNSWEILITDILIWTALLFIITYPYFTYGDKNYTNPEDMA